MTKEEKQLEVWKPIPNYEEYEVSNFGRVNCCNGSKKYTTCGGFIWKYTNSDKQITSVSKILQINKKDGSALNTWNSITEASKSLSISRTAITNCISGLSKTAGGYIWKKI